MKNKLNTIKGIVKNRHIRIHFFANYVVNNRERRFLCKISKVIENYLCGRYNICIGKNVVIGEGIFFPHPHNIIIGTDVKLGRNCVVYQDVTIGQNRGKYPHIGDDVIIYPGAKVIGDISIGKGAIIGANAVVTKNVYDMQIVGGVPAKVLGIRSENDEFY